MKDKKYAPIWVLIVFLMAVILIFWMKRETIGKVLVKQQNTATNPVTMMGKIRDLFNKNLISMGKGDRKLIFVDISDPSCPYSSIVSGKNSKMNNLAKEYRLVKDGGTYVSPVEEMWKIVDLGKADYVWIYNGEGDGEMGAKALYCANEMGKFREIHDRLYSTNGYTLITETVKNDKTKSGVIANFLKNTVPPETMKSCLDSGKYETRLKSDVNIAKSLGVEGSPNFFVNDKLFDGSYSFTDMKATVEAILAKE
jgi:protein-disulfide isomerase